MAYKIGNDIVLISRFNALTNKTSFINAILSSQEIKMYKKLNSLEDKALFLAKRWSIKEAILKLDGQGMKARSILKQITIINERNKKPYIDKNSFIDISISHENGYLFVSVVKEIKE